MGVKFEYRPVPKPQHKRRVKKNKRFTEKTIREIFERDNYQCIKCSSYKTESIPHHVIYRSQGGLGIKRNGVTVCRKCHSWMHGEVKGPNGEPKNEGRRWAEKWVDDNLDEKGDLKESRKNGL